MSPAEPSVIGLPSPNFSNPPLIEVALAVEFAPIAAFGAIAMAELAAEWRERYPRVQEHPPLPPNAPLGSHAPNAGMLVSVGAPQLRLWLLTDAEDRLVQLQRDRLIVNWRSAASEHIYPRYHDALRPEFKTDFEHLCAFLRGRQHPAPRVVGTEATYVNALGRPAEADFASILRSQARVTHHLGHLVATRLSQTWHRVTDGVVTSTMTLNAETQTDGDTMLMLTGRAAVPPNAETADVLRSLDVCHDDVVASFVELTEEQRHADWGRTS